MKALRSALGGPCSESRGQTLSPTNRSLVAAHIEQALDREPVAARYTQLRSGNTGGLANPNCRAPPPGLARGNDPRRAHHAPRGRHRSPRWGR